MNAIAGQIRLIFGQIHAWFADGLKGAWGASFLRIVLGITLTTQLVVNFQFRSYLWGPAAAWSQNLEHSSTFPFQRTLFGPTSDLTAMTIAYVAFIGAAIAFTLGWHTRIATVAVLVLHTLSSFSDGIYMDQSENFLRIALIYLVFMRAAEHWSLDARRHARKARIRSSRFEPYTVQIHNAAITGFGLHICLIYVASAMFKTQGSNWQNGTALFYPLNIPHFQPFPELSSLADSNALFIMVGSYVSVYVQLFFPFMLLNKYLRKVALLGIVCMHLGIAVLMGLPFFSFFMLAGDSIFVSSKTYATVDSWVRDKSTAFRRRRDTALVADGSSVDSNRDESADGVPAHPETAGVSKESDSASRVAETVSN